MLFLVQHTRNCPRWVIPSANAVGRRRREILDYIVTLKEQHLRRLIHDYVSYHHDDGIHDSLAKDTTSKTEPTHYWTAMVTLLGVVTPPTSSSTGTALPFGVPDGTVKNTR